MGLAHNWGRLAVGCSVDIWEFHNVPAVCANLDASDAFPSVAATHDACFLPRRAHCTGDVQLHEMAWIGGDLVFVNTSFSCLAQRSEENSFEPIWRPEWITHYAPGDNCHLNGFIAHARRRTPSQLRTVLKTSASSPLVKVREDDATSVSLSRLSDRRKQPITQREDCCGRNQRLD
ncbi:DUF4915 domain-containing protein [Botrimarina hoheduenensis]|uniref:Conserved hypothetical protein CHP03032 domain-containing protein n=1 Tax=Botrimarina hoheduenensis TaxID=2528000 RepID=A0A5C5WE18_9BACT|nr:hypothetical protein Pla111_01590 [Botrimarina hoheduenensis]